MTVGQGSLLPQRPGIVFLGTPDFAVPGLAALLDAGHRVLAVVTQPDRPRGRGQRLSPSPVKACAAARELPVLQPERVNAEEACREIAEFRPDLLLVIAFGQILKTRLLALAPFGAINLHASLLPSYRGAAPIAWAIWNGEAVTGLSAMQMEAALDAGPVLLQEEIPIRPEDSAGSLHDRMAQRSGPFLLRVLEAMTGGGALALPQDPTLATYAPKITRALARIPWGLSAEEVSFRIRALDPAPGAYTLLGDQQIKCFVSRAVPWSEGTPPPGRILGVEEGALLVGAGIGAVALRELQAPGKRRLPVEAFLRGFPLREGMAFR